jgi:hypothetical protein
MCARTDVKRCSDKREGTYGAVIQHIKGQAAHSFPSPKTLNTFDECLVEESR